MELRLTETGKTKYRNAQKNYRLSDEQLLQQESKTSSRGKAKTLTDQLLCDLLGSNSWYLKKKQRVFDGEAYLSVDEARHLCTTLKIEFDLQDFEIKPGSAPSQEVHHVPPTLDELDRWVESCRDSVQQAFDRFQDVWERRIHVPLEADLSYWDASGRRKEQSFPKPLHLHAAVERSKRQLILIWQEGGAGKTSLCFEIARWGLQKKLANHVMLPILLDPSLLENNTVTDQVLQGLKEHCTSGLDVKHVEQLVQYKRVLLIVDHFSELTTDQRNWVRHKLPNALVLLTSRRDETKDFPSWSITSIQPLRLANEQLFNFFEKYLEEKYLEERRKDPSSNAADFVLQPDDQVRTKDLLELMVGSKPITVLLACMVIDKALDHIQNDRRDLLPGSVPELMTDYVDRIEETIPVQERWLDNDIKIQPDWISKSLKALALAAHAQNEAFHPQPFTRTMALQVLARIHADVQELSGEQPRQHLLDYLIERLYLLKREGTDQAQYRVALDPLADYLAAMAKMEELQTLQDPVGHLRAVERWLDAQQGQAERGDLDLSLRRGFLAALRDCYRNWVERLLTKLDGPLRERWQAVPDRLAELAGINPLEERELEARQLIRRWINDLRWSNPELRPTAIANISVYAASFPDAAELKNALDPLVRTMSKSTVCEPDRAAAAAALGLIGGQKAAQVLEQELTNTAEPVAVRRAAAEALGAMAMAGQFDASDECQSLLMGVLEQETLSDETSPERIAAVLPLLQGASRGLQLLAARELPLWGRGAGRPVPMLTLTTTAGAVSTKVVEVPLWQLPLPDAPPLELVAIPPGEFLPLEFRMGSPEGEAGPDAYEHRPELTDVEVELQRTVMVAPFAMARYPVSQAQWRAVAELEPVERPLNADPAQAKGAELPVESVRWRDASEWCARLNRYLRTQLGEASPGVALPSEAQWEYACRAGSSTPFHFGDTIDAAWANYDATHVYPPGREGVYLQRPTPVGAYGLVNVWGLADVHGNVWEWCADVWHPSLEGGPVDGSAWVELVEGLPENRLLRGGSWCLLPTRCRSACRCSHRPDIRSHDVGFRVCSLPPELPA